MEIHAGPDDFQLEIEDGVDEVILAYRKDGELYELATLEPPAKGTISRK